VDARRSGKTQVDATNSPGSPTTGLRRWGGTGSGDLALSSKGHSYSGSALILEGQERSPVDTQTRHALKKDSFAQATASSMSWVSGHRVGVVKWSITAGIALVVVVGALVVWSMQTSAADKALGTGLATYDWQLALPGAPVEAGTYATAAERSKAANQQFADVASKYGWLPEGAKAHYFAGITAEELVQNAQAETELKTAAGAWDKNLANLAK